MRQPMSNFGQDRAACNQNKLEPPVVMAVEKAYAELKRQKRIQTAILWLAFIFVTGCSIYAGEFYPQNIVQAFPRFFNYISKTLPELNWVSLFTDIKDWYWNFQYWLKLLMDTMLMGFYATLFGAIGAFLLSFLAAQNLARNRVLYILTRRVFELSRTVPELVFAMIFVWAFGLGPMAGVLAISLHSFGTLGKLFSEINENCDMEQVKGIRATGATWRQTMRYAVLPQVLPNFLSYTLLRFEINVRAASVLGFVGAGGIGMEFYYVIKQFFYQDISAIALMLVVTVGMIDTLSERLRHGLIGSMASGKN